MNIIVYYSFETGNNLEKKTRIFVKKKGDAQFLLCEYIQKENLPRWIKRREEILRRFNAKISGQEIKDNLVYLFEQDKISLNRLILMYNESKSKDQFKMNVNRIYSLMKIKVKLFLERFIDKFVIPIKDIDKKLWSSLNTYLNNISDAKTIASGIQEHKKNKLVMITADKKDWNKENLEWAIPPASDLEKKYSSLPKIEYLQNIS